MQALNGPCGSAARTAASPFMNPNPDAATFYPRWRPGVSNVTRLTSATEEPRTMQHAVSVWFDDAGAAPECKRMLAAEGIGVEAHPIGHAEAPAAGTEALVLHISQTLAEQLPQLRVLRAKAPEMPLLVLSRGLRDIDQVLALEMGADDVLDAATAPPVVAARLRALWRRAARATEAANGVHAEPTISPLQDLRFGALQLLGRERRVLRGSLTVPLTEGEFEVLWLLATHAGQVVTRNEILKRVRGIDDQPLDRSVDCRVYRVRAKLGDDGAQRIRTVRNRGYLFSPVGW
jgi:DNA-binding response OmpR family regulator